MWAADEVGTGVSWLQAGVAGLVIIALLTGALWAKPAVDRLIADKQKAEAQRDALMEVMTRDVIPALTANTAANQALQPVMQDVVRVLKQVRDEMEPRTPAPKRRTGVQAKRQ